MFPCWLWGLLHQKSVWEIQLTYDPEDNNLISINIFFNLTGNIGSIFKWKDKMSLRITINGMHNIGIDYNAFTYYFFIFDNYFYWVVQTDGNMLCPMLMYVRLIKIRDWQDMIYTKINIVQNVFPALYCVSKLFCNIIHQNKKQGLWTLVFLLLFNCADQEICIVPL